MKIVRPGWAIDHEGDGERGDLTLEILGKLLGAQLEVGQIDEAKLRKLFGGIIEASSSVGSSRSWSWPPPRPIEQAPRDGTQILIDDGRWVVVSWYHEGPMEHMGYWVDRYDRQYNPTRYWPLPVLPQ